MADSGPCIATRRNSLHPQCPLACWSARVALGVVFILNVMCALQFVAWPCRYAGAFELVGTPGAAVVRGIGVLCVMWNASYAAVIRAPARQHTMFGVVVTQQVLGLAGEAWIWASVPAGHSALRATALRFILFDGAGLAAMGAAYVYLMLCLRNRRRRFDASSRRPS